MNGGAVIGGIVGLITGFISAVPLGLEMKSDDVSPALSVFAGIGVVLMHSLSSLGVGAIMEDMDEEMATYSTIAGLSCGVAAAIITGVSDDYGTGYNMPIIIAELVFITEIIVVVGAILTRGRSIDKDDGTLVGGALGLICGFASAVALGLAMKSDGVAPAVATLAGVGVLLLHLFLATGAIRLVMEGTREVALLGALIGLACGVTAAAITGALDGLHAGYNVAIIFGELALATELGASVAGACAGDCSGCDCCGILDFSEA